MYNEFILKQLELINETAAQQLVLQGLKEHFGFIDHSLNPDLYPILETYEKEGNVFMVGFYRNELICTGGLLREDDRRVRVARMSVARQYRGRGFAKTMLGELERRAAAMDYHFLLIETNKDWANAIGLYNKSGYKDDFHEGERIHMYKSIAQN